MCSKLTKTAKGSRCQGPSITSDSTVCESPFPPKSQEKPMLPILGPKFETQRQHQWSLWCTAFGAQNLAFEMGTPEEDDN